jgi:ubiquinone/menaquinone biosynthesis C-methylase UbiE
MNPAMLDVARALPAPSGATIRWQEENAMALPFPEGSFDVVLCQHGLPFFRTVRALCARYTAFWRQAGGLW